MLKLRPLLLQQIELRDRGIKQRLLLGQVESRGDPALMPMGHQHEPFPLNLD